MKKNIRIITAFILGCFIPFIGFGQNHTIIDAEQINPTTVQLVYSNGQRMTVDFYGSKVFRLFYDPNGGIIRNPKAIPPADILVENPRVDPGKVTIKRNSVGIEVQTDSISFNINKNNSEIQIAKRSNGRIVLQTITAVIPDSNQTILKLKEYPNEYFYGGGVQNGRFSHRGKVIKIVNENEWNDGGVASPAPFSWSTNGYGILWNTFKEGAYDFGAKDPGVVSLSHETNYLDVFVIIGNDPADILKGYFQLTGDPVLLPKFGFYEGHLNAYNRDFWIPDSTGILFEDGKRYKEREKDTTGTGIKESLNGEKNNYQFSARAVIDRYAAHDMPLGWILPNDGYGAGYGQTGTLKGNIENLKQFGDYARKHGVQIGLWTQSDLHPIDTIKPLLQRDIIGEVRDAGVRVLKTDVAWVGSGYSFGLHGINEVSKIMSYYGNDARPFIISLDGWAGTQRYAGVWTGDQTGGVWEYIRFHIPTYIGSGLSGIPNITSDMDGIYGGKNVPVNVRDFQWKTFTPMQLNMDGWGSNPKYPEILGEPAASINRTYLKLKSQLIPYTYSIAHEATKGLPMIQAMFLQYPNDFTHGKATQYQFMYGPSFLVAPIYQNTSADTVGNDIRNGIYLPQGEWIDYFTGEKYVGGRIINNFEAPLWKLPIFVKNGAIIPMANPNNHVSEIDQQLRMIEFYPQGKNKFTIYDDDGTTQEYRDGQFATTEVSSVANGQKVTLTVLPTKGSYSGFEKNKATEFVINMSKNPGKIRLFINGKERKLESVSGEQSFAKGNNVYYYNAAPELNQFATKGSEFEKVKMVKNPELSIRTEMLDITKNKIEIRIEGFVFDIPTNQLKSTGSLTPPTSVSFPNGSIAPFSLTPVWTKVNNADFYEIDFDGQIYSTIKNDSLTFNELLPEHTYHFKIRSVNKSGKSQWKGFSATTLQDPLAKAIHGIKATTSVPNQGGSGIENLFDFDENTMWHTKWGQKAVPFDINIDLGGVKKLNKLMYLPRNHGNGILLEGTISYGTEENNLGKPIDFNWKNNGQTKEFIFEGIPEIRFIKIHVTKGVGDFGSGREMYILEK